jgi:hypothetical protein
MDERDVINAHFPLKGPHRTKHFFGKPQQAYNSPALLHQKVQLINVLTGVASLSCFGHYCTVIKEIWEFADFFYFLFFLFVFVCINCLFFFWHKLKIQLQKNPKYKFVLIVVTHPNLSDFESGCLHTHTAEWNGNKWSQFFSLIWGLLMDRI